MTSRFKHQSFKYLNIFFISSFLILGACTSENKVADDDFGVDDAASTDVSSVDDEFNDANKSTETAASETSLSEFDDEVKTSDDSAVELTESTNNSTNEFEEFNETSDSVAQLDNSNKSETNSSNEVDEFSDFNEPADDKSSPSVAKDKETEANDEVTNLSLDEPLKDEVTNVIPYPEINNQASENSNSNSNESNVAENETPSYFENKSDKATQVVNPSLAKINNIKFLANDNGGTLVISSDSSLQFKTRVNSSTNQLIIEVLNSIVPEKLKRSLNTKDMLSSIGSVDIYQNSSSNIARFVIQLKSGSTIPLVQPEGNSLLVISSPSYPSSQETVISSLNTNNDDSKQNSDQSFDGEKTEIGLNENSNLKSGTSILNSDSLEDFLANNNKFYGKKMSIETSDMDVRDILKFISEESNVNMIFDDSITGKLSLKLRDVPWDQALVTVLKAKSLGYKRQGQVLRIGQLGTLTAEEEAAAKLKEARQKVEPLIVKNFQINYAEVTELDAKIKEFIKDSTNSTAISRGKVTIDARTNTLIVTDTASKLNQVEKLIQLLDTQPQQVLIEGRVVEATENYSRNIGVNFGFNLGTGAPGGLDITGLPAGESGRLIFPTGRSGPMNISPSLSNTPEIRNGAFNSSLWLGRFGSFGYLSSRLALDETDGKVKILSSPRVTVLHNKKAIIKQTQILRLAGAGIVTPGAPIQPNIIDVPVGVVLDVTPKISNIGTVNLDLKIERSAPTSDNSSSTSRDVTTGVIVKSGETAVIGGIFTSDSLNQSAGIPGLKDIPVLGTLFSSKRMSKIKTELMFFISPKILKSLDVPAISNSGSSGGLEIRTE